jgi:hypothetical protein
MQKIEDGILELLQKKIFLDKYNKREIYYEII